MYAFIHMGTHLYAGIHKGPSENPRLQGLTTPDAPWNTMVSWLVDFVYSLGHDLRRINPGNVPQGVTALVSVFRESGAKWRKFHRWAEISESYLEETPEDDFLRLLLWFTSGKHRGTYSRRVIFVTSSHDSGSLRKDALRMVANVVDLEGKGIQFQTIENDNSGGSDSLEPPGRMNFRPPNPGPYPETFSLATMIPGPEGEFGYNEFIQVFPEAPSGELFERFRNPEITREGVSEADFHGVRIDVEGTHPLESHREGYIEFREESKDWFCINLRNALAHIESALKITGGRAGRIVVIDLLRGGRGRDDQCMIEFEQRLKELGDYWGNNGPYGGLIWQFREV